MKVASIALGLWIIFYCVTLWELSAPVELFS